MVESVTVYVALGCNLGSRHVNLASALSALENHEQIAELKCSSVYETSPMGPQDQPDYLNAVVVFDTDLAAEALLDVLQDIETNHGRTRTGERWGPRTLDLDLLLYGDQLLDTPRLKVPHPGIADRSFVLLPLGELAPHLIIPAVGAVSQLITQCQHFDIRRLNSSL